jgi:hypothetical protein
VEPCDASRAGMAAVRAAGAAEIAIAVTTWVSEDPQPLSATGRTQLFPAVGPVRKTGNTSGPPHRISKTETQKARRDGRLSISLRAIWSVT